jgi:hypothetical protein
MKEKRQCSYMTIDILSKYLEPHSHIKPVFKFSILGMHSLLKYILKNVFSRMHFDENSAFGKILKLFIKSDYAEKNCVWLIF